MPTYEVRRVKPIMVSVVTEAETAGQALWFAQQAWVEDATDDAAYEVKRQPLPPDDDYDARSEARDEEPDWREQEFAARWGVGGSESPREGTEA